jgi:hypothetical protein
MGVAWEVTAASRSWVKKGDVRVAVDRIQDHVRLGLDDLRNDPRHVGAP